MILSLQHPGLQTLAWTLLHFLWQGALLGLLAKTGLWFLRGRSPQARYLVGCAAMAALAAAPVVTFLLLQPATLAGSGAVLLEVSPRSGSSAAAQTAGLLSWARQMSLALQPILPWAVALWLAGVALLGLRLLGGWVWLLRLRTRLAEPAGACWQMTLNSLARRMKVNPEVRILRSWAVDTLMVVGWVKPLILVPAAALANLAPEALEAVLAHELAHVRRHDYLVNLIQSVIEVLLFYHPAVWWISAQIRQERELCCDDAAVSLCGDAVLYARALAALEGLRGDPLPETRLAPAAHGGSLMNRIQRLLSPTLPPSPSRRAGILAALAVTALGAGTVIRLQETPKKPAEASTGTQRKTTNIVINEDKDRLRVKIQGEVKIRPDAKIDLALAEGASIEISGTEKGQVRRFKASREQGAEERTFSVNGKEAPVDQAWLDQRLDQLHKLEAKTADAREKAKLAEHQTREVEEKVMVGQEHAKDAAEKAHRIEVRVRKLGKDGKEIITEDVHLLPGAEPGHSRKRIVIKKGDGSHLSEIEELHGPGKIRVFEGPDSKKIKIDVERMTKDAHEHARKMKVQLKDLDGPHDRLKVIDTDFDFDFDDGDSPKVLRWNMKTPAPGQREKSQQLQKQGQQKEVEVLRREIERLQKRLDRLQERLWEDGMPPPPPPPPAPRAPKTPKASPMSAPPPPPAPPAPPAPPRSEL